MLYSYDLHHGRSLPRAIEMRLHLRTEFDGAVLAGKKCVVIGAHNVCARDILCSALTDDDLADRNFLAVLKLDPKPFGYGIAP